MHIGVESICDERLHIYIVNNLRSWNNNRWERDNTTSECSREGALVTPAMHGGDGGFDSDVGVSLMEVGECGYTYLII